MNRFVFAIFYILVVLLPSTAKAQEEVYYASNQTKEESRPATIYLMPNVYPAVVMGNDTVACMWLHEYIKYSNIRFKSNKDKKAYDKLIRDVKKTLPYAKEIANIIVETYEYMETLNTEKARQEHLNKMESHLKEVYTPKMKKLTRSQGQLLIKLVDRETNSSSYHIVDAFMGSGKAIFYNAFASLFGNSLKKRYQPYGDDRITERVCVLVEQGAI